MNAPESRYVLIGEDGTRHGPMPRYRVVELVERGFFGTHDQIQKDGEEPCLLANHPEFAGFFIEGDSRFDRLQRERDQRRRRTQRYRWRERRRSLVRFGWGGVGLGAMALAIVEYDRWVPDAAQDWFSETVLGRDLDGGVNGNEAARGRVVEPLLDELRERLSAESEKPAVAYDRGVQALVSGERDRQLQSVQDMERAVLFSQGDAWTVGGLIAALSFSEDIEAARRIDSYVAHLKSEPDGESSLNLGLGVRALVREDFSEAAARASSCMREEHYRPLCHWIMISALGRTGQYDQLAGILPAGRELFPESPEVLLWTADSLRASGEFADARSHLQQIAEVMNPDGHYHRVKAALEREVGDFQGAADTLRALSDLEPGDRLARLRLAVLLYQHRGDFSGAATLLDELIENGLEDFAEDDQVFLHASHVQRALGNPSGALEHAKAAVETGVGGAAVQLARAMALDASGDLASAEAVWDEMELEGMASRERARIHAWAAKMYLRTGRLRLASDQIGYGELADPNWPLLSLLGAAVDLQLGDHSGLESRLKRGLLRDIREDRARSPVLQAWGIEVDAAEVAGVLRGKLVNEPRWARVVPAFEAAVELLGCSLSNTCDGNQTRLRAAVAATPNHPLLRLALAHSAIESEEWQLALDSVRGLKPELGSPGVLLGLEGAALVGLGRHNEAVSVLEEGFRAQGSEGTLAGRWLVRAHVGLGNWEEAALMDRRIRKRDPNVFVTAALLQERGLDSTK